MASTYLTRTPATATNRKTFTFSSWIKISNLTPFKNIFQAGSTTDDAIRLRSSGTATAPYVLDVYFNNGSNGQVGTNMLFRDVSAWYHIVCAIDTTQATSTDRIKVYINGTLQTLQSINGYPTLNYDTNFNNTIAQKIGTNYENQYFDGSMAHVHFTDGTAYDVSAFGETDATSGIWKPKTSPSVTYGTNGFFLKFANSASLGTDSSGNGNNFTVNGSGTQTLDTPSNVFATINTLVRRTSLIGSPDQSFIDGNLTSINNSSGGTTDYNVSTLGMTGSGKYYAEVKIITLGSNSTGTFITGISKIVNTANFPMSTGLGYRATGEKYDGANSTAYGATLANGDIVGIAFDLDSGTLTFYKNGVSQGTAFTSIDASETWFISTTSYGSTSEAKFSYNFGNGYFGTTAVATPESDSAGIGKFEYSVPSGYYALCTKNIATYG